MSFSSAFFISRAGVISYFIDKKEAIDHLMNVKFL